MSVRFIAVCAAVAAAACGAPSTGLDDAAPDGPATHDAAVRDTAAPPTDAAIPTDAPADDAGADVSAPRDADLTRDAGGRDASDGGASDGGASDGGGGPHGVTVVGARLQRDGAPLLAHGFNMIGALTPDGCSQASGLAARASFGAAELTAARDAWHANTVRLQVSQPGLDPTDAHYSAAYIARVRADVAQARALGLVVIVSMQDQSIGCGAADALPTNATLRAWDTTAPLFRDDPDVLFELFNEPQNAPTTAGWAQWRDGGSTPLAITAVGHQALVDHLRTTLHVTNVLVADGANHAGQLQGIPHLTDSLSPAQIAYAVHPYYFHTSDTATLAEDTANWDARFGYLTDTVPLLATEWNASASCFTGQLPRITDFFAYLAAHHIGLFGHAFDVRDTMVTNLTSWTPTTFTGCSAGSDAGALVQAFYATL